MPDKNGFVITSSIEGREYLLNNHLIIEIAVTKEQGPEIEEYLENMVVEMDEYFKQIARDAIDERIGRRIVEMLEQENSSEGINIFRDKIDWIKFRPFHSLKTHFILVDDGKTILSHDKLYGVLSIDVALLIQNIANILGDISQKEIWDEVLWNVYDIFQTCFFESEDFFPISREIDKKIKVPVWCEAICGNEIDNYFCRESKNFRNEPEEIGVCMRVKLTDSKQKMFILPMKEFEIEQKIKLKESGIEILDYIDEFIETIEDIIYSTKIIS